MSADRTDPAHRDDAAELRSSMATLTISDEHRLRRRLDKLVGSDKPTASAGESPDSEPLSLIHISEPTRPY